MLLYPTDPGAEGTGETVVGQGHVRGPRHRSGTRLFPCQRMGTSGNVDLGTGGTRQPATGHVGHYAAEGKTGGLQDILQQSQDFWGIERQVRKPLRPFYLPILLGGPTVHHPCGRFI